MARSNARLRSRGLANATGTKEVRPVRLRGPGSRTKLLSRTYPHALHPQRTPPIQLRSEEHTSELQSLMRISYAVFCLKKKKISKQTSGYYTTIVDKEH